VLGVEHPAAEGSPLTGAGAEAEDTANGGAGGQRLLRRDAVIGVLGRAPPHSPAALMDLVLSAGRSSCV
jgi:hypothetical protein